MKRLELVIHPDVLLRDRSQKVTDIDEELVSLTDAMIDTMHRARGIGLAGVQVGRLARLFVTHVDRDTPRVFINPSIVETSVDVGAYEEGCLSIPGVYADVNRPLAVKVQAWNEKGRPFTLDADGLLARVIQHELDHLNGVLFIDHIADSVRESVMADYDCDVDPATVSRR